MDVIITIQEVYGQRRMRRFGAHLPYLDYVSEGTDPIKVTADFIRKAMLRDEGFVPVAVDSPPDESCGRESDDLIAEMIAGIRKRLGEFMVASAKALRWHGAMAARCMPSRAPTGRIHVRRRRGGSDGQGPPAAA